MMGLAAALAIGIDGDWWPLAVIGGIGAALLGLAVRQVRRGRWQHVDASRPAERRTLNGALLAVLLGTAAVSWWLTGPSIPTRTLVAAAGIIVAALVLTPWLKLSLHVAFAVLAAFIPGTLAAGLVLGALAVGVAWARLALRRHTLRDVIAAAACAAVAGAALRMA